jgi:hypothetical protein|tara:strand:+ start:4350 stop:5114 length:765 start_codon:yes stop_codon:yes gene_type:complete
MASFKLPSSITKMSSGKVGKTIKKVVENQYVLYFVFFLAFTNLLGYLMMSDFRAITVFILIGYIVHQYTKNMIIVLAVPLILTSMLLVGRRVKEGLENKKPAEENDKEVDELVKKSMKLKKEAKFDDMVAKNLEESKDSKETDDKGDNVEPTGKEGKKPEEFTGYKKNRNRIDYAATVEDAYNDLNNILGSDGIKNLTQDTQKLMGQQLELADAMKNMTPLLDQAKSMLQGFDMKSLGNLSSFAQQFGAGGDDQ